MGNINGRYEIITMLEERRAIHVLGQDSDFLFNTPETDNKSKYRHLGSHQTKNNQKNEQTYR